MSEQNIYRELALRTQGACMLGVVGPVRTGKSTFIKRFMETLVIPAIENDFSRQRARDELPQSGSGRSIMTAEPKFVPEEPVSISLGDNSSLSVRLVDCVGYMVEGAVGQLEDGEERMVTTPWFDHEVTMTEAAEKGTALVIREHASVGIVVTCDGSICDLPRDAYVEPERRVIRELQEIGKPFVVLLNSADPTGERARGIAAQLEEAYGVSCRCVNCLTMGEQELVQILRLILEDFPLRALQFDLPAWVRALGPEDPLKLRLYDAIRKAGEGLSRLRDQSTVIQRLAAEETLSSVQATGEDLGTGTAQIRLQLPRSLYYALLSERSGVPVKNDGELMRIMSEMCAIRRDYERLRGALEEVRSTGYGVVLPSEEEMQMEEPQIVRQNGKYTVKLRASAPAIHMLRTQIECEVNPDIGGDGASEDILGFLLQGFDGDVNRIWESKIFGRSLNELAEESLTARIRSLPDNARERLRETLQRLINEGSGGLICILL
jgi:stage IV sporulation protein A